MRRDNNNNCDDDNINFKFNGNNDDDEDMNIDDFLHKYDNLRKKSVPKGQYQGQDLKKISMNYFVNMIS